MQKIATNNEVGLVSNCWKIQLDAGVPLTSLVHRAVEEGFRFVELRQGCLGECEDSETRLPHSDLLNKLAQAFLEVTFDLAVELPIFSEPIDLASKEVEQLLDSAQALSSDDRPAHLRIVDLVSKTAPDTWLTTNLEFSLENVIESLSKLSGKLPGGVLSIEHSFQSWAGFRKLFEVAMAQIDALRLCYDPCNLWLSNDDENADQITESLPVEWLSMVHLKQWVGGSISTQLEPGVVNWARQIRSLSVAGYKGPFLFEIAPSEGVLQRLTDSRHYLADVVRRVSTD